MAANDNHPSVPTKDFFDPIGNKDMPPPPPPSKQQSAHQSGFGTRMANAFRRTGNDRETRRRDREAARTAATQPSSTRMDVIDRMDMSGLGASREYLVERC